MKRSEINKMIDIAGEVFDKVGCRLPPFGCWTAAQWDTKGMETTAIKKAMLGWDVTDFGQDRFTELGRTLFTLRNGYRMENGRLTQCYAEKFILDPPNQRPPLHFHRSKMEDIINRGGGNILILLYEADADEKCSKDGFTVTVDGIQREVEAGAIVRLEPGQSINIPPRLIHQFWGEEGTGLEVAGVRYTVSGEVSSVCDDWGDNYFFGPAERFPRIEEDVPRKYYLCNEYPASVK